MDRKKPVKKALKMMGKMAEVKGKVKAAKGKAKAVKASMVDQFSDMKEAKKKVQKNVAKGPVDVAAARAQVKAWNAKNRKPV